MFTGEQHLKENYGLNMTWFHEIHIFWLRTESTMSMEEDTWTHVAELLNRKLYQRWLPGEPNQIYPACAQWQRVELDCEGAPALTNLLNFSPHPEFFPNEKENTNPNYDLLRKNFIAGIFCYKQIGLIYESQLFFS